LACDLAEGRLHLPGGLIDETDHWLVEHCIGPLGVGTLVVKPRRHVLHVWELTGAEANELGPLLQQVTGVLSKLVEPDQIYVNLWSHAGGTPVHIHWVVQPVTRTLMDEFGVYGPALQMAMFERGEKPAGDEVEAFAAVIRERLASGHRRLRESEAFRRTPVASFRR
jgi:diadenosine tetraphosphate (Ap4A) HIT family hydrolase